MHTFVLPHSLLRPSFRVWLIIAGLTLFRLVYIAFAPITEQEAYYWLYSQHPDMAYVDHPPMVAYSIYLGTRLFGDTVFGIKFLAVIGALVTNILLYNTVQRALPGIPRLESIQIGILALVTYNLTLFAHAYAIIQQPDSALLLFWLVVIYFVQEFQLTGRRMNLVYAGIGLGLGLLCKYTAAALLPGVFIALLFSAQGRRVLLSPYPWVAVLLSVLLFSPVIYWNWQQGWVSFQMQFVERGDTISSNSVQLKYFLQLVLTQLVMLMPLVFLFLPRFFYRMIRRWKEYRAAQFYFLSGVFIIVGFTLISFISHVKTNWLLPGYLGVILGIVLVYRSRITIRFPWISCGLIVLCHILFLFPGLQILKINSWSGWDELTHEIIELQDKLGGPNQVFIFSDSHKISSYISFYSPGHQRTYAKNIYGVFSKQFTVWGVPEALTGKSGLMISSEPELPPADKAQLERYFDRISPIGKFTYPLISFGGNATREVYCFLGTNYRLHPL